MGIIFDFWIRLKKKIPQTAPIDELFYLRFLPDTNYFISFLELILIFGKNFPGTSFWVSEKNLKNDA